MQQSQQLPRRRWSLPLLLSVLLAIADLVSLVLGVVWRRPPLLLFGIAGLGASFTAISVGWALDFRLSAIKGRWRIRAMHWFFNLVASACVLLAVVDTLRQFDWVRLF